MKSEKRLIDADELIKRLQKSHEYHARNSREIVLLYRDIRIINEQPTVDAVVLPCKVGDFVWAIRSYHGIKHPQQGKVIDMHFTNEMKLHIVVSHISRGEWGKTVFATREEAEAAIAERKDNG